LSQKKGSFCSRPWDIVVASLYGRGGISVMASIDQPGKEVRAPVALIPGIL
jgi:hypothetical protein